MLLIASATLIAPAARAGDEGAVSFSREIRPILSDTCFACHGPDAAKREADLRLDTPDGATADLGGYAAVVPGNPDESELYLRLVEEVDDLRMPPPDSGKRLTAEQVEKAKQLFNDGSCNACHVLADAGAAGTIGPAFDGNAALTHDLAVDRITNGQGAMPSFGWMPTEDIDLIATYIVQAKK